MLKYAKLIFYKDLNVIFAIKYPPKQERMIDPKIYMAKATKTSSGGFSVEEEVDIHEYFKGACYKAADGLEAYGKPRTYEEEYPEAATPDIYFPDTLTRETSDFTLTLYFFDPEEHEEETDAIKAIDEVYHAFVEYITGTYIKYWDNVRQRKVMLAYQEATKPTTDSLYGVVYKEVGFKFKNLYGKSFPLDSAEF